MIKFNSDAKSKRVTQQEIARLAGVSHVAVSYALHRKLQSRISKEKQQEIRQIAQALGYRPRAMTTHTIALAMPVRAIRLDITNFVIRAAGEALRNKGYRLTLAAFDDNDAVRGGYMLDQKNADGVILTDPLDDVSSIVSPDLPRVLMADANEEQLSAGIDQVTLDTVETMKTVVSYAVSKGHRRIGLVASVQASVYDNHLREGLRAALKEQRLSASSGVLIEIGDSEKTAEPVLNALSQQNAPTLIIAGSAARALLVVNGLQWARLRVPDDVSVISFIDSHRLPQLHPAVTATTAAGMDVVSLAIDRLLHRIENPDLPAQRTLLPGAMIERDSVRALS